MQKALAALRNGEMGLNATSRAFQIPKATLKRHLDEKNAYANNEVKHFGHPKVLTDDLETLLVEHVLKLDAMFFGVNRIDLRKMAYQLAEQNDLHHTFNKDKCMAGKSWYYDFLKRHPELSLRHPEATSLARAQGFNRESVSRFFDLLESEFEKYEFDGMSIYNMDESGLTTVQKPMKVVSKKGKRQVGSITSAERGSNTTVVCCVSAAGRYVPPMVIFKRKRMPDGLKDGVPSGSIVVNNDSGWMDSDMFKRWLMHFQAHVGSTKDKPVLLILDGHASHTKNVDAITFARDNGIVMMSLPPHTTHKLQPLDCAFFKPLKSNYNQAADKWMRNHPGRPITVYQICGLFGEAYVRSSTMSNALSGFAKCGIWPCNRNVFTDDDFAASDQFVPPGDVTIVEELQSAANDLTPTACNAIDSETNDLRPSTNPLNATTSDIRAATNDTHPTTSDVTTAANDIHQTTSDVTTVVNDIHQTASDVTTAANDIHLTTSDITTAANDIHQTTSDVTTAASDIHQTTTAITGIRSATRETQPDVIGDTTTINTCPDGRCFFRSLAIAMDTTLQNGERDPSGLLTDPLLRIVEQTRADSLRAEMVTYMCLHFEEFHLDTTTANADLPGRLAYNSMQERVEAMAAPTAMVGEIEIIAATKSLRRQIDVVFNNTTLKYGEIYQASPPLVVRFTRIAEDVGHYDCVLANQAKVLVTPAIITPLPTLVRKAKTTRSATSEIITSSPYKRKLLMGRAKKGNAKANPKASKRTKKAAQPNEASWYCFLCGEDLQENMVRCCSCARWVHVACASNVSEEYVCDECM